MWNVSLKSDPVLQTKYLSYMAYTQAKTLIAKYEQIAVRFIKFQTAQYDS